MEICAFCQGRQMLNGGVFTDKKRRVLDCIDGKPIDKVPFSFWHHYQGEQAFGKACVAAHKRLYDAADMDFIKMNSNGFYPIDFRAAVTTPSDWDHLVVPNRGSAYFSDQVEMILRMREAIQDEACVFYVVFAAYSFLCQTYGKQLCDAHLRDPQARGHFLPALERVGDFVAELCTELLTQGGATGIFEAYSSNSRFTPEEYQAWIRPQDQKQIAACEAAGRYNIVHLCGGCDGKNHFASWYDYRGAVIHWDQHLDWITLAEGKVLFPNKRAVMGGFDNRPGSPLYTAPRHQLQALAKNYAMSGGRTGFLLSADCTVDASIKYERLAWVGEALWEASSRRGAQGSEEL